MTDVIALTGYAGVGKDTVADILVRDHGYTKLSFADKVKELLLAVNPWIIVPEFGGTARLQALINTMGWHKAKRYPEVRRLLQELGTETRNVISEDVWINPIIDFITHEESPEKIVVSDVRFANELEALRNIACHCCLTVTVVRLTRAEIGPANDHQTETLVLPHDLIVPLDSVSLDQMPYLARAMNNIIKSEPHKQPLNQVRRAMMFDMKFSEGFLEARK